MNDSEKFIASRNRKIAGWGDDKRERDFYFIQLADTQLGMAASSKNGDLDGNPEFTAEEANKIERDYSVKAVNAINLLSPPPDFVIVCGDLVNAYPHQAEQVEEIRDFKSIFSNIKPEIKLICLCGNHDVGNEPNEETIDRFRDNFGDDYFSFYRGGVKFFGLNSQLYKCDQYAKQLAKDQHNWLEEEVESMGDEKSIVFSHIPPFIYDPNENDGYFPLSKLVRMKILKLLSTKNCTHWFAGHYHRNAGGRYQNIEVVTSSAIGATIESDPEGDPLEINGMKSIQLDESKSGMRFVFIRENATMHMFRSIRKFETNRVTNAWDLW